jgi:hypothetical protein
VEHRLLEIARNPEEDERIRLEAWGSLAHHNPDRYVAELIRIASRPTEGKAAPMALAMESIFILSELHRETVADALAGLAEDRQIDLEARCAAVWGLGTAGLDDATRVLPFIADTDDDVALHALAAIGGIESDALAVLNKMLFGEDREAASAATLLAEDGEPGLRCLLDAATHNDRSALRARAALGQVPREDLREVAGSALPGNLETALLPMWAAQENWLNSKSFESPLDFLRRQRIRYLPDRTLS